jgi:hypothetical protein
MSSQNNNFMTTITKNPLVISGIVVVVIIIIILIASQGSKESFSPSSESKDIVENYPQSTPMNVMYSDAA